MKFILQAGNWYDRWSKIENAVPEAESLGFWGFAMPDHYMWGEERGGNSTLETWTALTFLAARTERIKIGTLVTPIPLRPPGLLAKLISTLDLLSGGRSFLGVGAGWSRSEFEGYAEWDEPSTRVEKTQEGIELILRLWSEKGAVDFEGKYYCAKGAVLSPKPLQKPHPPLLFGSVGRRMLRMAGRYADICCIPPWTQLEFEKAKEIVLESAREHSRRNEDISFAELSFFGYGTWERNRVYKREEAFLSVSKSKERGSEYFITGFPHETYLESMRDFARNVIPSFS